jgi:hypothetical protein
MGIFQPMICCSRRIVPSTSSRQRLMALQLAFSSSTMLQVTRSELEMLYLHEKCPRIRIMDGPIIRTGHACKMDTLTARPRTFTFQMPTQRCLDGSRAWSRLSRNEDFGRSLDFGHNARALNVSPIARIAVADDYYSVNPIFVHKSLHSKNSSLDEGTSAISTPNSTAS